MQSINVRKRLLVLLIISVVGLSGLLITTLISLMNIHNSITEKYPVAREMAEQGLLARFYTVQVQQYLTDVSATGEAGGFNEAKTNFEAAQKRLNRIAQLQPDQLSNINEILQLLDAQYNVGVEMAHAYMKDGQVAGNVIMKQTDTGFDARTEALTKKLEALDELSDTKFNETENTIESNTRNAKIILPGAVIITMIILVGLLVSFGRHLMKLLGGEPSEANQIIANIASGNLTNKIYTAHPNSLIDHIFKMQQELNKVIVQIRRSADETVSATNELSGRSAAVVESSRNQSQATATMGSAIEEVSVSIKQMSEHADQSQKLSEQSAHIAQEGEHIIAEVAKDMEQLSGFVKSSSASVEELGKQSEQIHSIVNVIKSIADQTNLLALNAAIEAARAGEQGRGFAVVADEVRSLAARTSSSTKEIADMIAKIQQGTNLVVDNMEESVARTTENVAKVNQAVQLMTQIRDATASSTEASKEIALTLNQQAIATDLLSQNVEHVAQLAAQNSDSIEHVSDIVEQLNSSAAAQQSSVEKFTI